MICHGDNGGAGGVVQDLRYAATLGSADAWKSIVLEGSMVHKRMIPFSATSSPTMETIRATSSSARTTNEAPGRNR